MKKIDLLVQRCLDFTAASEALFSVDERNITALFPAVVDRNVFHLRDEFLMELAKEAGLEIQREYFSLTENKIYFQYGNIKFYALEKKYGTP